MIKIRKSEDRGHANHGWLDSYHTFSFADYRDPQHMGFRSLRVINDDRVAGGGGFDTHPHRDMEIITFILSGALQHRDSMGHTAVMKPGEVQRISAGTGIEHSEFNYSPIEPVRLLQIWILPERRGLTPGYAQQSFADTKPGQLRLLTSRSGRDGSIQINQEVDLYLAKLGAGGRVSHSLKPLRHGWVQVAEGEVSLNGQTLKEGDAAALSDELRVELSADQPAQVLVFDLN
jgi:redox-sensitive bicupin YhaK (pirin superfamily)